MPTDHVPNYGSTSSTSEASSSASSPLPVSSKSSIPDDDIGIPPSDRGRAAWLFLFGCFWLEGLVWGLPFSFGIFEKFYSKHEPFASQPGVPAIGSSSLGLAYFLSPVLLFVLQRWPSQRRNVSVAGLVILTIAIISASFATRTAHLILTQGVMYGLGGAMVYNPFIFYMDEWFVERKGLAYGIFWAGTGVGSAILPFVTEWSLHKYGFRTLLRAWGIIEFIALAILIYFVKPRKPLPKKSVIQSPNLSFLTTPLFWAFQTGNIFEGLGYFIAPIWLPSFCQSLRLPALTSTLSVALLNLSTIIGLILTGQLIDHLHVTNVLLISAITSTLTVLLLWGFATTPALVYTFCILFGITAGGYTASWTGCATEVKRQFEYKRRMKGKYFEDEEEGKGGISKGSGMGGRGEGGRERDGGVEVAVVMGTMAAGRGIGCFASGPISEILMKLPKLHGKGVWGTQYAWLVIFVGLTMLLGRFGLFGRCGTRFKEDNGKGKDGRVERGVGCLKGRNVGEEKKMWFL